MMSQRHNHLSADEVISLIDEFGRNHAELRAYIHLRAKARGRRVILRGGVRGWANDLQVSEGSPRRILQALTERGKISVAYHNDGIADVYLVEANDRSTITSEPEEDDQSISTPHQEAISDASDRSTIDPPHTPHEVYLDSRQQQQHGDTKPDRTFLVRHLAATFPRADPRLFARWQADEQISVETAFDALNGFPTASLADWQKDLAAAKDRDQVTTPVGLVLALWARGERVGPPRPRPAPAERTPRGKDRQPKELNLSAWSARDAPAEPALDEPVVEEAVAIGHTPPQLDGSTWGRICARALALSPPLAEWLDELQADVAGDLVALTAATDLQALALEQRFAGYIRRAAAEECGRPMYLRVRVASHTALAAAD
jgi:hypothetical protein